MENERNDKYFWWAFYAVAVVIVFFFLGSIVDSALPKEHTKPQQWYIANLETDTCVNARTLASSVGVPQIATPHQLGVLMENHQGSTYAGTKTYDLRDGRGKVVELMNDQGGAEAVYFSEKRGCEKGLQFMEGGN